MKALDLSDPHVHLDELNARIIWLKAEISRLMEKRAEIDLGNTHESL